MILTPLQKLPNNVSDLGRIIVATGFELLPKLQKIAQSGHTVHNRCTLRSYCSTYSCLIIPLKALKSCSHCKKLPNLVTLPRTQES